MTQVGRELREARERLGWSIEDIERRTKIKAHLIRAIEEGDTAHLPGGLYARGFMRAYAHEVGCDVEGLIRALRGDVDEVDAQTVMLRRLEAERRAANIDVSGGRRAVTQTAYLALMILFSGGIYLALNRGAATVSHPIAPPVAPPVETLTQSRAPSQPVGTSGADLPKPVEQKHSPLQLDIQPTGECWLSVTVDGQRVIYRMLNAGEKTHVEAADAVDLRVGDPATFAFAINGANARLTGTPGEAVSVRITPDNYRQFLAP